jgi:hypothetical protein
MNRPLTLKLAVIPVIAIVIAYVAGGPAGAEQSGNARVKVSLDGSIAPKGIPRDRLVPVSLSLRGAVRGVNGAPPPPLQRLEIAFGASEGLDTGGLPVCPRLRLRNATANQALARCRAAVVGQGSITAEVHSVAEEPLDARAAVLAFNGRSRGQQVILFHAYSASPPVSFVLPFHLQRLQRGPYGLLLRAPVGRVLGRLLRLRSFHVTLKRRFRVNGTSRSYLNAKCPLPPSFSSLSVPFARATYFFASGMTLSTAILRRCRVRE